jgi:hypothetical protein
MGNRSRFVSWVGAFGYSRLARELKVARPFVHSWTNPKNPVAPANRYALQIVVLSRKEPFEYGPLTLEDLVAGTIQMREQDGGEVHGES